MVRKVANEELGRLSVEEFKSAEKIPLVVVLDNIRSMHNVGSVFRTADAFTVERVILAGITAKPPHRDIRKTALGATESVAWEYYEDSVTATQALIDQGYSVLAIEQASPSVSLESFEIDSSKKYAVVLGNEVFGVKPEIVEMADCCVEIPQYGTKHSLNVSVSAGLVLWELCKQMKKM